MTQRWLTKVDAFVALEARLAVRSTSSGKRSDRAQGLFGGRAGERGGRCLTMVAPVLERPGTPAHAPLLAARGFGALPYARNQPAVAEAREEERVPRSAGRPLAQSEVRQRDQPGAPERDRGRFRSGLRPVVLELWPCQDLGRQAGPKREGLIDECEGGGLAGALILIELSPFEHVGGGGVVRVAGRLHLSGGKPISSVHGDVPNRKLNPRPLRG